MSKQISDYLVVSDMDGTLLRAGIGLPQQNVDAVRAFSEAGGHFTVATGRHKDSARRYLDRVQPSSATGHSSTTTRVAAPSASAACPMPWGWNWCGPPAPPSPIWGRKSCAQIQFMSQKITTLPIDIPAQID